MPPGIANVPLATWPPLPPVPPVVELASPPPPPAPATVIELCPHPEPTPAVVVVPVYVESVTLMGSGEQVDSATPVGGFATKAAHSAEVFVGTKTSLLPLFVNVLQT